STVMVRRSALGEHRFVPGLEPAEDRDLWFRLVCANHVYVSDQAEATAVLEPNSLSRSGADSGYAPMIEVLARHADVLGSRGVRNYQARVYRDWAAAHLGDGRPRDALKPATKRLRLQPLSPQ